jgi:hypothetical protein
MSGREWVRLSTMRSDEGRVDLCLAPEVAVDCLDVNGGELSGFGGSSRIIIFGSPLRSLEDDGSGRESPKPPGAGLVSRLPGPHGHYPVPARPPRPEWETTDGE